MFENITLERLEDILRYGKGNFVILIGGTWDSATTAALPAINTAAKQGIEKIYNFDPHLDTPELTRSSTSTTRTTRSTHSPSGSSRPSTNSA